MPHMYLILLLLIRGAVVFCNTAWTHGKEPAVRVPGCVSGSCGDVCM